MFHSNHSLPQLWQQLFEYQLDLHRIAAADINSSPQLRDQYQQRCLNWLTSDNFDAIYGGLYIDDGNQFRYSLQFNLLAAELLASVNKVVLHGDLFFNAQQVLTQLASRVLLVGFNNLSSESYIDKDNSSYYISGNRLLELLQPQEIKLLQGLLNKPIETHQQYLLCWRQSLIQAAEQSGIHIKQAQILQHTLINRLKAQSVEQKSHSIKPLSLIDLAKILATYSHMAYWYQQTEFNELEDICVQQILAILGDDSDSINELDNMTRIEVSYALVEYLMIRPCAEVLNLINQLMKACTTNDFVNFTRLNWYQWFYIQSALELFDDYQMVGVPAMQSQSKETLLEQLNIVTQFDFSKQKNTFESKLQQQDLASRYSLTHRVFLTID